jgi:hypothetical protein
MRLLILLVVSLLQVQSTPSPDVVIKFKNGSEVRARLVEVKPDTYTVDLQDGRRMSYPAADVDSMQRLEDGKPAAPPPAPESKPPAPAPVAEPCRIFVTEEQLPVAYYTTVKKVKWNRKYYGSSDPANEKLAIEAAKLGADAVMGVEVSHRPSGFAWSTPHVTGTAVKWTEQGRANFGTLKGECVTVPGTPVREVR